MNEKTKLTFLNLLRIFIITVLMFFGFSILIYYVFYKSALISGWPLPSEDSYTYFQILGKFFSLNWIPSSFYSSASSRVIFEVKLPGTRDLAIISLLCGGIPGIVGGLRKKNKKKKNILLHFIALGFTIPMGVFLSFLGVHTLIFPSMGIKSLPGSPTFITGSRLLDSLFALNINYFLDTLWHVILPLIGLSFVTFCLALWISTKTRQEIINSDRNWQRINIRFLFAYIIFYLMIVQANFVFHIDGIEDAFIDLLAYRDNAIVMFALFYLTRFISVYFIFNCIVLILSVHQKLNQQDLETEPVKKQEPFFQRKSNIVIVSILGILTLGYIAFTVLSLLPQFGLGTDPSYFEIISWGIQDSFLSTVEPFIIISIISLGVLFLIVYKRNQTQTPRQFTISQFFFSQLGRDVLLLLFMPFCMSGTLYTVFLHVFYGYFNRWVTVANIIIFSIPILLFIDVSKKENEKINLKKLTFRILSVISLISFVSLIINDTNGIMTGLPYNTDLYSFWEKLQLTTPLAYLSTSEFVYLHPMIAILSGIIIWSFYLYWMLGFILFKRLSSQQKAIILNDTN